MTLEELRDQVLSAEEWAERVGKNVPKQDGEWVKNIWYLGNEPLYYALEKIGMTDRYAIAVQTNYQAEYNKLEEEYSHLHPTAIREVISAELEWMLHAEPSEEEMTLPVEIPDTRTEAQKAWDGLFEMMDEVERNSNSLEYRLKE